MKRRLATIALMGLLSVGSTGCDALSEFNEYEVPVAMAAEIADRFADLLVEAAGEDGILKGYQEWSVLALGIYTIVKELQADEIST